jgi:hypothetical protein
MLDDLDDLIDGVAREMTASQPTVAFTRRVAARVAELESEGGRRREWQPVGLLAPAAACIAVLAVLVVHHRLAGQPSVGPRSDAISSTVPAETTPPARQSLTPVAEPTYATTRAQARGRVSDAVPGSAAPAATTSSDGNLAPLVTTPLEMEPLGVAALAQAAPIEVDALSIGRIDVTAMP